MLTDPGGFTWLDSKAFVFPVLVQVMPGRSAVTSGSLNVHIGPNYGTSLAVDRIIGTPTSPHWAATDKIDMHILPQRLLH